MGEMGEKPKLLLTFVYIWSKTKMPDKLIFVPVPEEPRVSWETGQWNRRNNTRNTSTLAACANIETNHDTAWGFFRRENNFDKNQNILLIVF